MKTLPTNLTLKARVNHIAPFRHPELSIPGIHGYIGRIGNSDIIKLSADDFVETTANMGRHQRVEKIEELLILIREKLPSITTNITGYDHKTNYSKLLDVTFNDKESLEVLNYVLDTRDRKFNPGGWKTKSGDIWNCTYGLEHLVENERFTDHYDSLRPYQNANVFNLDKLESKYTVDDFNDL